MSAFETLRTTLTTHKNKFIVGFLALAFLAAATVVTAFTVSKEITVTLDPKTGDPAAITTQQVSAKLQTPLRDVLIENNLPVDEAAYTYSAALDDKARDLKELTITAVTQGEISADGRSQAYHSTAATVAELLAEQGVELGAEDIVTPSRETPLTITTGNITVQRVAYEDVATRRELPFETRRVKSESLGQGEAIVATAGQNGLIEVTERITTIDGVETGRSEVAQKVIQEPVAEVIEHGETIEDLLPGRGFGNGGKPVGTSFTANCSAYSDVNHVGHGASGNPLREGYTVAADPSVYPYGTKIYIPYFNATFEVVDCGTSIKGNCVDIYFDSYDDTCAFGRKQLEAYVVE